MTVFGLTGPSGAGKGEVAALFAALGISVLDADQIYHELLVPPSPCLKALTARFGEKILNPDGSLNRTALGDLAFSDSAALRDLNAVSHKFVMEEVRKRISAWKSEGKTAVLFDAPQLFEAGAEKDCDVVISVLADQTVRLNRILARDKISEEAALRRMSAQKSDAFFRSHSDYILENNGDLSELLPKIEAILSETGVRR